MLLTDWFVVSKNGGTALPESMNPPVGILLIQNLLECTYNMLVYQNIFLNKMVRLRAYYHKKSHNGLHCDTMGKIVTLSRKLIPNAANIRQLNLNLKNTELLQQKSDHCCLSLGERQKSIRWTITEFCFSYGFLKTSFGQIWTKDVLKCHKRSKKYNRPSSSFFAILPDKNCNDHSSVEGVRNFINLNFIFYVSCISDWSFAGASNS